MMKVLVNDAITLVSEQEVLTEGTVNARKVQFDFSREWESLNKTAVFTNGVVNIKVLEYKWEEGNVVSIPPEVLSEAHRYVQCGIFGEDDEGKLIFPTIWAKLGKVLPAPSTFIAEESVPPTPTLWEELQLQIGNLTHLDTENKVNLVHAINEIFGLASAKDIETLSYAKVRDLEEGLYIVNGTLSYKDFVSSKDTGSYLGVKGLLLVCDDLRMGNTKNFLFCEMSSQMTSTKAPIFYYGHSTDMGLAITGEITKSIDLSVGYATKSDLDDLRTEICGDLDSVASLMFKEE